MHLKFYFKTNTSSVPQIPNNANGKYNECY